MDIEIRFNSRFLLVWRKRFKRWRFNKLYAVARKIEGAYYQRKWFENKYAKRGRAEIIISTYNSRVSIYIPALDKCWDVWFFGVKLYDYTERAEIAL